ncbi:hypothetical protein [Marimonas arenosa]|uniref:Reprolysin-like metallo-peptidase family M12B n=1 Tax=Marimonas arenosa TaxID=1795305 RepID=A0AAE4B260_9RHOB|nr:hypothetical protein [Marimonas arenosa]MDQ2088713.1 hypothetical protein [Marimonas arenosa]
MNFRSLTILTLLTCAAPISSALAAPDAPREVTATVSHKTGGPFFLIWRGDEETGFYRVEKKRHGSDDASWVSVGETDMPHWIFDKEPFGRQQYRIQGCLDQYSCSDWVYSSEIEISSQNQSYPVAEGTQCGHAHPPTELAQKWAQYFQKRMEYASTLVPDEEDRSPDIDPKRLLLDKWKFAEMTDAPNHSIAAGPFTDADGDCLLDANDPDPFDSDSDDDGWFDGPCNARINLVLTGVKAEDETEDTGKDEFYLIVDKARFPNRSSSNGYWSLDDGDTRETEIIVASRTRGFLRNQSLAQVSVFGMEDDVDPFGDWQADDTLFSHDLNLDDFDDGQSFTLTQSGNDFKYVLTFRVDVEPFADPDVQDATADRDGDGVSDEDEAEIARVFGGVADPFRKDIVVEVDNFRSGRTYIDAMRQVHTAFARKGVALYTLQTQLDRDTCLSRAEVRDHYNNSFDFAPLRGVRYAMLANGIYNDRSGVALGRSFVSSKPTVRFGLERAMAGTFMHELGHTLGLRQSDFHLIDKFSLVNLDYQSSMTYFFQPLLVRFSSNGGGFTDNFDDWEHISVDTSPNPQSGNQSRFTLSTTGFGNLMQTGSDVCQ